MKQLIRFYAMIITLCGVMLLLPASISAQQNEVNFQLFYNQLSPYGHWVEYNDYGYVWLPSLDSEFIPYLTDGYWIMSEYGWTWVSDFEWGWAPFHYGRWDYDGSYGWFWVPDNEWGPSWVTWRMSEGYYGWAPMRPGVSVNLSFGGYHDVSYDRWNFVRDRDIERHDLNSYHADKRDNEKIFNNSSVINNTYNDEDRRSIYIAGPRRRDVEKSTGRTINQIDIKERDKPGQEITHNQLILFRPKVNGAFVGEKPVPARVERLNEIRKNSDRNEAIPARDLRDQNRNNEIYQRDIPQNKTNNNRGAKLDNSNPPQTNRAGVPKVEDRNSNQSQRANNRDQRGDVKETKRQDNSAVNNPIPARQQEAANPVREKRIERPIQPRNINPPERINSRDIIPKTLPVNQKKIEEKKPKDNSNTDKNKTKDKNPF